MFVIDSTGSMKEDIEAAKAIANEIVAHERKVPVSFILSTFSDPGILTQSSLVLPFIGTQGQGVSP